MPDQPGDMLMSVSGSLDCLSYKHPFGHMRISCSLDKMITSIAEEIFLWKFTRDLISSKEQI
jgi:hypothetical protein